MDSGLGCNAGGHQPCRFCGFGLYEDVECQETITWVIRISIDQSKYDQVQLLSYLRRRQLRSASSTFSGAFAEGLATWLAMEEEDVIAESSLLSNSTANLLVSIYTADANRTQFVRRQINVLTSPERLIEALGLQGYPFTITHVEQPAIQDFEVIWRTRADLGVAPVTDASTSMGIVIAVLGAAVVLFVILKVRKRWRRKNGYSRTRTDSSPNPRRPRGWDPQIDDTAPTFEGLSRCRRNSDPGSTSASILELDEVRSPPPIRRNRSTPSSPSTVVGARVSSLVANVHAIQAKNRLATFKAEAEARRLTNTAAQEARDLVEEAKARMIAADAALKAREEAVAEAERAKQEAERIKQEAEHIRQEALMEVQERQRHVVKEAEAKAQLMQGMQNVMQQLMTEESRILHDEEMEALNSARKKRDRQRELEEEEARANLQMITEKANEAARRLQEAVQFEEESKAALDRMAVEKRRLQATLNTLSPRIFTQDHDVNSFEDTAEEDESQAQDVDSLEDTADDEGRAPAGSLLGIDVDALAPAAQPTRMAGSEQLSRATLGKAPWISQLGERGQARLRERVLRQAATAATSQVDDRGGPQHLEERINRFEQLTRKDLDGDGDVGIAGGWKPKPHGRILSGTRGHPAVPIRLTDVHCTAGLELTASSPSVSSTSMNVDKEIEPFTPQSGTGQAQAQTTEVWSVSTRQNTPALAKHSPEP